jgi:hypothetical protein
MMIKRKIYALILTIPWRNGLLAKGIIKGFFSKLPCCRLTDVVKISIANNNARTTQRM